MHTCHGFSIFVIQIIKEGGWRGRGWQKDALHKREDWQGMSPFPPHPTSPSPSSEHPGHCQPSDQTLMSLVQRLHYGLKSTTPPCTPISALFIIIFKFPLQPHQKYYITQYEERDFSLLTQMKDYYVTNIPTSVRPLYLSFFMAEASRGARGGSCPSHPSQKSPLKNNRNQNMYLNTLGVLGTESYNYL